MVCPVIYTEFGDLVRRTPPTLEEPSEALPAKEKKDISGLECTKRSSVTTECRKLPRFASESNALSILR